MNVKGSSATPSTISASQYCPPTVTMCRPRLRTSFVSKMTFVASSVRGAPAGLFGAPLPGGPPGVPSGIVRPSVSVVFHDRLDWRVPEPKRQ